MSANKTSNSENFAAIAATHNGREMITAETIAKEMHNTVRDDVRLFLPLCESLQRAWEHVARIYGMSVRRVRAYWANEVRNVPAHEADTIRALRLRMAQLRQDRLSAQLAETEQLIKDLGH